MWQLAPELESSAAREVDYIADYARTGELVSEAGTACAGASQSEFCQPAFDSAIDALPGLPGSRLLLTTEGDQVRLWTVFGSPQLLGEIDTVEEAIWTALGNGYAVPCDARLSRRGDSFELDHLWWSDEFGCPPRPEGSGVRIAVTPEGEIVSDPAEEVCAPITR